MRRGAVTGGMAVCLVCAVACCAGSGAAAAEPLVVGYVNYLRVGHTNSIPALNYDAVDVVVHGFLEPLTNGTVVPLDDFAEYRAGLIAETHGQGKRILVSVGGALPARLRDQFAAIAASESLRAAFASNIVCELNAWGYDGVDIDYEFPSTPQEKADFTDLMRALYAAVKTNDPAHLVLFGASTGYWIDQYEWDELAACSDFSFYYGYEWRNPAHGPITNPGEIQWTLGGHQIEASVRGALLFMSNGGYPLEKIVVGLPFYTSNYRSWYEVRDDWATNAGDWTVHADYLEVERSGDWWTCPEAIDRKMSALLEPGSSVLGGATVGGVGFWEFGHEDPAEPDLSETIRLWKSLRRLRIQGIETAEGGSQAVCWWPGERGLRYAVQTSGSLRGWSDLAGGLVTTGGLVRVTNGIPGTSVFYRVTGSLDFPAFP